MTPPVELITNVGVRKDDLTYGSFRKWLTPVRVRAMVHLDLSKEPKEIGTALGFVIRRTAIRKTFHKSMEPPDVETMVLAFTLFDRYGRLKQDIQEHTVRQGSGVWKAEVNNGNIVLIKDVNVEQEYRRQGVGTKLVLQLLETAMASRRNVKFAFAQPMIYDRAERQAKDHEERKSKRKLDRVQLAGVTGFFRSLHFRRVGNTEWFGLARDADHPSRQMPERDDPDLVPDNSSDSDSDSEAAIILCQASPNLDGTGLKFTQTRLAESDLPPHGLEQLAREIDATGGTVKLTSAAISGQRYPLHYAMKKLPDRAALAFIQEHAVTGPNDKFGIETINGHNDNVLHVAAKASKPACVSWITNYSSGPKLSTARNNEGYTPLEALQAQLEERRILEPHGFSRNKCVADRFNGYDDGSVACLLTLMGTHTPTTEQRDRAKFGCTCGVCTAGFLSPRMAKKLCVEAEVLRDHLVTVGLESDAETWHLDFKNLLAYMPSTLSSNFRTNRALQRVFTEVMIAVTNCLVWGSMPSNSNIERILKSRHVWAEAERLYFSKGGTVAAVANIVIDNAKQHDVEIDTPQNDSELDGLPRCRNDVEFEFVRRHCIDDAPQKRDEGAFAVDMPWIAQMSRMILEDKDIFS